MELMLGSLLLRCDRGMFELFTIGRPEPTVRFPVQWLGVVVDLGRRGRGTPVFGTVRGPDAPLYGQDKGVLKFTHTPLHRIGPDEDQQLRWFLSVIAERYGRRLFA